MKDNVNAEEGSVYDDIPPYIDEEIVRESDELLRKAVEKTHYQMRKSIEALQEDKKLHDLIDDYDFDGLDEDE